MEFQTKKGARKVEYWEIPVPLGTKSSQLAPGVREERRQVDHHRNDFGVLQPPERQASPADAAPVAQRAVEALYMLRELLLFLQVPSTPCVFSLYWTQRRNE